MSDRNTYVYIDLNGHTHFVGRLWSHIRKGRESASFLYDSSWLKNPIHFSLEPSLIISGQRLSVSCLS